MLCCVFIQRVRCSSCISKQNGWKIGLNGWSSLGLELVKAIKSQGKFRPILFSFPLFSLSLFVLPHFSLSLSFFHSFFISLFFLSFLLSRFPPLSLSLVSSLSRLSFISLVSLSLYIYTFPPSFSLFCFSFSLLRKEPINSLNCSFSTVSVLDSPYHCFVFNWWFWKLLYFDKYPSDLYGQQSVSSCMLSYLYCACR